MTPQPVATATLLPTLSRCGPTAPPDLAPTVLVRVGLADEYFTAESPDRAHLRGLQRPWRVGHRTGRPPEAADAFEAAFARSLRATGPPVTSKPASGPSRNVPSAMVDPMACAFDLRGLTVLDRRPGGRPDHPARRDPALRLAGARGRPARGGPGRRHGAGPQSDPHPHPLPPHRAQRRAASATTPGAARRSAARWPPRASTRPRSSASPMHGERYIGSDTTHIVCLPTCHHARRVMPRHQVPFRSLEAAAAAGYRPCKVCRP